LQGNRGLATDVTRGKAHMRSCGWRNLLAGHPRRSLVVSRIDNASLVPAAGSGVPTLSPTYTGFLTGQSVSSLTTAATVTTTASAQPNVGSYITASGVVDPNYYIIYNPGGNYAIGYTDGTLTVNAAPLTVTGISGTGRAYNAGISDALTGPGSLSGLYNGQTLTLGNATSGTLASANAGSEAVTTAITLVSGTGLAGNYVLTQPSLANVTIAQAPLTVLGTAVSGKVYDSLGKPICDQTRYSSSR
jgi:MBG domain (YGX type)/YDG domain